MLEICFVLLLFNIPVNNFSVMLKRRCKKWAFAQYLKMNGQNLAKFYIHFINDKKYVCTVQGHFSQICNRVTALDGCQKLFLNNILRMDGQNLTKFCIHIIIGNV